MTLEEHIETVQSILNQLCKAGVTVKKSKVFDEFSARVKTDIELYRFERELSKLVRDGKFPGYEIKVGRYGGIARTDQVSVQLVCPKGQFIGSVSTSKLNKFLTHIKCVSTNKTS